MQDMAFLPIALVGVIGITLWLIVYIGKNNSKGK